MIKVGTQSIRIIRRAISKVIGIFFIIKPIKWTMKKFPYETYCIIIGFVVGSTWEIFE